MKSLTNFDKIYLNQPKQKPRPEVETLERGNGILLKKQHGMEHSYWVVSMTLRWSAKFTSYEDALLFFNIKNAQF